MAYGRKTELIIGSFKDGAIKNGTLNDPQTGYLIDGLDYDFDITVSTFYCKNTATFTIYNMNDETRQQIMNGGGAVIFKAGYEDEGLGTIFVGQVAMAYPENQNPETTKLVLICKSQRGAQYDLKRTMISIMVDEGKTYYEAVKMIADYAGVALTGAEPLKQYKLQSAYIHVGNIKSAIEDFTQRKLRALGGFLFISNNEITYMGPGRSFSFSTSILTYQTGLIDAQQIRDETYQSSEDAFWENTQYYLGMKDLKDFDLNDPEQRKQYMKLTEPKTQPRNGVKFECLLNPALHVGDFVVIDARKNENDKLSVKGEFFITDMHYGGGNYQGSDFKIEGTAYEYAHLMKKPLTP